MSISHQYGYAEVTPQSVTALQETVTQERNAVTRLVADVAALRARVDALEAKALMTRVDARSQERELPRFSESPSGFGEPVGPAGVELPLPKITVTNTDFLVTPKKRGRPKAAVKLSPAEKQREYRQRKRDATAGA